MNTILTEREKEIAELVATGMRLKDIAKQLYLSQSTISTHLDNVYKKRGVRNKTELAILMIEEKYK
ncbi:response regulator transcription factor [Scytonema sp. NUACC26]|uniref:response regulator transcription factor n=1 Tax=Scytonema sp. NUACC26 TaxID=3140176 RepID=UPI0034DC33BC